MLTEKVDWHYIDAILQTGLTVEELKQFVPLAFGASLATAWASFFKEVVVREVRVIRVAGNYRISFYVVWLP